MRLFVLLLLTFFLPFVSHAQLYSDNWRQDALEAIEDGRLDVAKTLLKEATSRENYISDPIERINHGRFLGDAYYKLGKQEIARSHFTKAMKAALELKPVWRSLSAVISVLELQATTDDTEQSRELIQQSIDAKLLPNMAKDHYASEIGRYVKRFEKASRAQVYQLLNQLRGIEKPAVRRKALYALTKMEFAPFTGEGKYQSLAQPLGMEALERFFWFSTMAKYYAGSGQRMMFNQQVGGMQKAYDRLGEERQKKYRKTYRMVKKLRFDTPKKVEKKPKGPKRVKMPATPENTISVPSEPVEIHDVPELDEIPEGDLIELLKAKP